MTLQSDAAQLSRRFDVNVDLGFSRWETMKRLRSNAEFDLYLARPRGSRLAAGFYLKATPARTCGTLLGAAVVERDRFLGSLLSPRLLPTVDFVRPRLLSPTQARRGCVVAPIFSGRTLEERLAAGETFSPETLAALFSQLSDALSALHRVGWVGGDLTPSRVLLADPVSPSALPTATLVDFSAARRFERSSLLDDASCEPNRDRFDAALSLPAETFFDPFASPERDFQSLRRFIARLSNASSSVRRPY